MFSDDEIDRIFARKEMQLLPVEIQSMIVHAMEEALEEGQQNAEP